MTMSLFRSSSSCTRGVLPLLAGITLGVAGPGMPVAAAADSLPTPDPATAVLEQLRAADRARTDLATTESAWALERSRLLALVEATAAETGRLERDAGAAETARDAARTRLAALGNSSDLDLVRTRLAEAGTRSAEALAAIARTLPPGIIPTPADASGENPFDAAVRALEVAERAATGISVEVVTGERNGTPQAVKMLRVAGAAAWWVALDGRAAGLVAVHQGQVRLIPVDEPQALAIADALAQVEGRHAPTIAVLPALPESTSAGGQP